MTDNVAVSMTSVTEIIAYLADAYPQCFAVYGQRRRPLKIGISDDLAPLVPFAEDDLKAALRYYTRNDAYLRACVGGASRIDLDGNAVSEVTAKEAAHAKKVLSDQERWKAKKKAARNKVVVLPPKGDGFAALKAAAIRRREVA
jgi:sRNA-binding protein